MASWFTRVLDRITPWDRGGEVERRKKREEEQQRRQQSQPSRTAPQPTVRQPSNNIRSQTIGGQDFLGFGALNSTTPNNTVSVPRNDPQEPQKPQVKDFNISSVDKGLDAGKSWEDISKDTGVSLDRVREHSQRTRPEYGIKTREKPALSQPKPLLTNLMSGQVKQQEEQVKRDRREAELDRYFKNKSRTLRDEAPRQNFLTEVADMVPFLGTKRSAERGRGLNDPSTERQNIGLSTTFNMSLSDIEKLEPEDRADLLNQARRVNNLELNTGLAGDLLSIIPGTRFLSSGGARLARDQGRRQAARTLARNTAKTAAIGTPVGTAISAGMQQYLTGDVDWSQALRGGLMGATVGQLIDPFGSLDNFVDVPRYSSRSAFRRARGVDAPSAPDVPDVPNTRPIDVQQTGGEVQIPTRNTTPQGNIIREVGGDSPNITRVPTSEDVQSSRFRDQSFGGADQRIEGITGPVSRQEYTTKIEIDTERQALNDALANKEINKTQHKAANKELDAMEKSLEGRKIDVEEVTGIPVEDRTVVPQDVPVEPGTVRATSQTDPQATKTARAAEQQAAAPPVVRDTPASVLDTDAPRSSSDDGIMTSLIQAVQDNRKIQKAERALNRKEKAVRTKEKNRLYNEMVAQGMSRREAEARSYAAMRGKYTDLDAGTAKFAETDAERIREMVDNSSLDDWQRANTKKAFEHLIDPQKTDPLQPHERRNILRFVQDTYGKDTADLLDQAIESAGDNRSFLAKLGSFFTSSTAAADLGAPGRQGLNYWVNHPRISKQALDDSLKSAFDQKVYDDIVDTMIKDPRGSYIQEKFSGLNALTGNFDEARAKSDWASSFKGTSWYVNPSERAYNMYMTRLRWGRINDVIDKFGGVDGFEKAAQASKDSEKWIKAWDKVINTGTGRGGNWNGNRGDLQVLFSARHLQSKVNRLTAPAHLKLLRDNPQAYLTQLREVGTSTGAWALTLAAAHQAGIDVEDGKIRVGDTRIDISGGLVSLANAVRKGTDAIVNGTDGPFDRDARDIATDYLANQLSPMLASVATLLGYNVSEGKDRYGNELTPYKVATDVAPIPIGAQGVVDDAMQGTPAWQTVMNAGLDFLGFGTNTYQTAADKDNAARAETADVVGAELTSLRDSGLLNDQMISTMSDSLQNVFAEGKTPNEKELGQIKDALVKGIGTGTGAGSDTAYRERGNYDMDLAVLQLKKQILEADPTTKPSNLKDLDVQIKRSQVLLENEIPYELFNIYQTVGLEDWRDLEETNPELYQQLWELDELFTKAGGSYGRGDPTKQKYYAKKGSGRSGGTGRSRVATNFGTLGSSPLTPRVREYDTGSIGGTSNIPVIRVQRPEIVHRIGRG